MDDPQHQDSEPPRTGHRDLAGTIGWGLLFALAALILVLRMMGGGGGC